MKNFIIKIVISAIFAAGLLILSIFLMKTGFLFMGYEHHRVSIQSVSICFIFSFITALLSFVFMLITAKTIYGLFGSLIAKDDEL